jgi:hypothetical protein
MSRVYLSGPMTSVPFFNRDNFLRGGALLRAEGHEEVFNPWEEDVKLYGEAAMDSPIGDPEHAAKYGFCLRRAMGADHAYIAAHAEEICFLPRWEFSNGALSEFFLARNLKLATRYLTQEQLDAVNLPKQTTARPARRAGNGKRNPRTNEQLGDTLP